MHNMNRIPAWDGSAEKWTEYENEVLWSEQCLKPSERPQLVARLFKALTGPCKKAIQSESAKTFAGKDAEQYLEFLQQKVVTLTQETSSPGVDTHLESSSAFC